MSIVQNQIRTGYILLATIADAEPAIYDEHETPLFNLGDSYYNSLTCLIYTVIRDSEDSPMYWGSGTAPLEGHIYLNKALGIFYGVNNGELFANIGTVDLTNPMHVNLDMDSHKLLNVANGTSSGDAVNKGQLDLKANISDVILNTEKGVANGVAELNNDGIVPMEQLPVLPIGSTSTAGIVKPDGVTINSSLDGTISVVAEGLVYRPNLFEIRWSDHLYNNVSWLRADTFSWQSGSVYSFAYNHLVDDMTSSIVPNLYGWSNNIFTTSETPSINDPVYISNAYGVQGYFFINGYVANYSSQDNYIDVVIHDMTLTYKSRNTLNDTQNAKVIASHNTETISGTTITYYQANDGHKIVLADQETNVNAIYTATGVAWYYVLDTANTRFKLPRTKFGFTGLRSTVGGFIEAGLPNITGNIGRPSNRNGGSATGAFYSLGAARAVDSEGNAQSWDYVAMDASRSSSIYGNSATVQPPATQMYLYFYVGQFTQSATEQTAGLNTELFNGKADISLTNVSNTSGFRRLIEVYKGNDGSWYKVFAEYNPSNGNFVGNWCEQGGTLSGTADWYTVTYLKPFANNNYFFSGIVEYTDQNLSVQVLGVYNKTTTGIKLVNTSSGSAYANPIYWKAEGYIE